MDIKIQGWLFTFALIGGVIAFGWLLSSHSKLSSKTIRKIVHILVSFWFFIYVEFMLDIDPFYIISAIFILLVALYFSISTEKFPALNWKGSNKWGTVYYLISLEILIVLRATTNFTIEAFGVGFLTMGFGDGLAGLIGSNVKSTKLRNNKTVLGCSVMFIITLLVINIMYQNFDRDFLTYIALAMIATALEVYSPKGTDNLSVPILTALIAYFLL